jgi:hypothetical protein
MDGTIPIFGEPFKFVECRTDVTKSPVMILPPNHYNSVMYLLQTIEFLDQRPGFRVEIDGKVHVIKPMSDYVVDDEGNKTGKVLSNWTEHGNTRELFKLLATAPRIMSPYGRVW